MEVDDEDPGQPTSNGAADGVATHALKNVSTERLVAPSQLVAVNQVGEEQLGAQRPLSAAQDVSLHAGFSDQTHTKTLDPPGEEDSPQTDNPPLPDEDYQEDDGAAGNEHQAIILRSTPPLPPPDVDSDDDDEATSSEEEDEMVGPIHPHSCNASGSAISGGAAGTAVRLNVQARDSNKRRVGEGGAYVQALVQRVGLAAQGTQPIVIEMRDNGDGTYTGSYTVPMKGNYEVCVKVNGEHIGDSPFPVFFSAPSKDSSVVTLLVETISGVHVNHPSSSGLPSTAPGGGADASLLASVAAAASTSYAPPPAAAAPSQPTLSAFPNMSATYQLSLGVQAVQLGVQFPLVAEEVLKRTVLVGGISPFANQEALQSVFGLCGSIRSINFSGSGRQYAFIEFSSEREAQAACSMTGIQLLGQAIRVENACVSKTASLSAQASATNPFHALQAHQVQAYQLLQQQQAVLAQHVAAMRHPGGGPGTAVLPAGVPSAQQQQPQQQQQQQQQQLRKNSSSSYRRDRDRDRSRSRDRDKRRRRSRSRSRDRDYKRREHRSPSRDRKKSDKDRHRDRDRRKYSRSRSRDNKRDKESRKERRKRSRSRSDKRSSRDKERRKEEQWKPATNGHQSKEPPRPADTGVQVNANGDKRPHVPAPTSGTAGASEPQSKLKKEEPKDELDELFEELEG